MNCCGVGHAPESIPMLIPAPAISGSSPVYLVMVKRLEVLEIKLKGTQFVIKEFIKVVPDPQALHTKE